MKETISEYDLAKLITSIRLNKWDTTLMLDNIDIANALVELQELRDFKNEFTAEIQELLDKHIED